MKDVTAMMLRRLDEEISSHNHQIAMHQVGIQRAQDARRLLMGIAEDDAAAAEAERAGPALLPGSHAKMEIVARKVGSGDEPKPERRGGKRVSAKPRKSSARNGASDQIVELLQQSPTGLKSGEVMAALGEPQGTQHVYQMLHYLKKHGTIERDEAGYYSVPKPNGALPPADELRERVTKVLAAATTPLPSADIIAKALGRPTGKGVKDKVYYQLRDLTQKGVVKRHADGRYELAAQ